MREAWSARWRGAVRSIDAFQRRHRAVAFGFAVAKKYGEDQGGRLAALLTYYGFLSIFPLLLLVVAVISNILATHAELRERLLAELVSPELQAEVEQALTHLPPSGLPLLVGCVGLLFAGTGGVLAAAAALDQVWAVPFRDRAGLAGRYVRTFVMLAAILVGAITAASLGALSGSLLDLAVTQRAASAAGAFAVAFALLLVGSRVLTRARVGFGHVWPGALVGAAGVALVFGVGGNLLGRLVVRSGPIYGSFSTVIGVFTLLYLTNQLLILGAEVSAVRTWRLSPRALEPTELTDADRRALRLAAQAGERLPGEHITVHFDDSR
jgi:membrane protein